MVISGQWAKVGRPMAGYDIVHIAVAPPDILEMSLIKEVATILNKDSYETRLLLTGRIPRIVARYQTTQIAESVAQRLRVLGLVTILCSDLELRKPSVSFRAHSLKIGEGEVIFCDKGGRTRIINVFLILKGTMRTYIEKEATKTAMKFSLPATVLTGGIPIWRRVKEKTKDLSIQTESFVRLYDWISPDPSVEILQSDFDYSFLGAKMAPSSLTNLSAIVKELRNRFPQAVFDDSLTESFRVDIPFTTPWDDLAINCKLIYLYHQAVSSLGPSV
jgi:hypothetical protein